MNITNETKDWNPLLNAVIRQRDAMAVKDETMDLLAEICKALVKLQQHTHGPPQEAESR